MKEQNSADLTSGIPLCVDLDGTLIRTDLLHESYLRCVIANPLNFLRSFSWLLKGRAFLKAKAALSGHFDASVLPLKSEVLYFIKEEKSKNRPIYLVTAAASHLAGQVLQHDNVFTEVISSSDSINLKGDAKASHLVKKFGEKKFDYIGDSSADIPVFLKSRQGHLVTSSHVRAERYKKLYGTESILTKEKHWLLVMIKAMRVHQWAKNLLIFLPLVLAHQFTGGDLWLNSLLAFISFSLCASGVYLINDLSDLDADRKHHTKRFRPLASGELTIPRGLAIAACCFTFAFSIAGFLLPIQFFYVLGAYFIFTCLYSFLLKEQLFVDAVSLAMLYTVRIIAGHAVTDIAASRWLLTFSMFLFLSLALLKRTSELFNIRLKNLEVPKRRAYQKEDFFAIQGLGIASGFISVLVFMLYLDSNVAKNLYQNVWLLMPIAPVFLYWIGRAWILGNRGLVNEDPIVWALKDRKSHLVLVVIGILFLLAQ